MSHKIKLIQPTLVNMLVHISMNKYPKIQIKNHNIQAGCFICIINQYILNNIRMTPLQVMHHEFLIVTCIRTCPHTVQNTFKYVFIKIMSQSSGHKKYAYKNH